MKIHSQLKARKVFVNSLLITVIVVCVGLLGTKIYCQEADNAVLSWQNEVHYLSITKQNELISELKQENNVLKMNLFLLQEYHTECKIELEDCRFRKL